MDEFEDRLRGALHARARSVAPDPDTWQDVEARIRRRQVVAWTVPSTAVVAVAVLAVFVLPGILPGAHNSVELSTGDERETGIDAAHTDPEDAPLTEAEVHPVAELEGRVHGVAWLDGHSIVVQTADGRSHAQGGLVVGTGLTAAPGSHADRYTLAAGTVDGDGECQGVSSFVVSEAGTAWSYEQLGTCVSAPRFSPDGQLVARIIRDGGQQTLDIRPFVDGGTEDQAAETAELIGAEGAVDIAAWMPDATGREALYLLDRGQGQGVVRIVPVDRSFSTVTGEATPGVGMPFEIDLGEHTDVDTDGGWSVAAATPRLSARPLAEELVMLQTQQGRARLWLGDANDPATVVDLPDELAAADHRAWVSSEGDDVLVGDGLGRVWHVRLDATAPEVGVLDVAWIGATLLPFPQPHVADADEGMTATAFFVRSYEWVEPVEVAMSVRTVGVARAAMELLVSGDQDDLLTLAPHGTVVLGAAIDDGVLVLDLSAHVLEAPLGSSAELLFAQQLAHTAAQFEDVDGVRLLVEGAAIDELWGHLSWSEPIMPDETALSPVIVSEVSAADGTVVVEGSARTFEATVELALVDPDGEAVAETFATATCAAPCRGEWTHTFEGVDVRPGTWQVRASEPFVTEEGPAPFAVSRAFQVLVP